MDVWTKAGLKVLSAKWLVAKVRKYVAHDGIRNDFSRMNATGKRGKQRPMTPEPTDRKSRSSTESGTSASMSRKGPVCQKGRIQKNSTRKTKMENLLGMVFEIGVPDSEQPAAAMEFLTDQVSR